MANHAKVAKGSEVVINFLKSDTAVTTNMRRTLEGRRTTISKVHTNSINRGTYYELFGCMAPSGIPYSFSRDMFRVVKEA